MIMYSLLGEVIITHYFTDLTPEWIENKILQGKSISLCNLDHNFYSSAIVTGVLPIALGTAIGLKETKVKTKSLVFRWRYDF